MLMPANISTVVIFAHCPLREERSLLEQSAGTAAQREGGLRIMNDDDDEDNNRLFGKTRTHAQGGVEGGQLLAVAFGLEC